jgi:hypothetical protein
MSKVLGDHIVLVPTQLGGMSIRTRYISGMDVEDIVRARAESQATLVQLINIGKDVQIGAPNSKVMSSAFVNISDTLEE